MEPAARHQLLVYLLMAVTAVAFLGANRSTRAQSASTSRLDLETAVSRALESDPQIRATRIESSIAQAKVNEARTGWQPTIQFNQTITNSNNPVFVFGSLLEQGRFTAGNFAINSLNHPDPLTNFRTSVSMRVPLFDKFQTRSRVNRANIEQQRGDLEVDLASQRLRFDVIKTFYGAILADELLLATDAAVASARQNTRMTGDFVAVGLVSQSDSLVASVELATVEQQKLESQSAVITTRAALNIAIGNEPDTIHDLVGNLQEKHFPVEDQAELIRIALARRPEYQQALLAEEQGRERTKSLKHQKLPRVDAFGDYGYSSPYVTNGSSDYTVGLSLSYTLFDPGRKSRIEQATLAETRVTAEKDRLSNQITLEVVNAYQHFNTARSKIRVSVKSVIQAEEALRMLQDRYRAELITFDGVLRGEAALLRAKHDLLKAKYEYYVSFASILFTTGRLTDVRWFD